MSFIAAEQRAREVADNCGPALDMWRGRATPFLLRWLSDFAIAAAFFALMSAAMLVTIAQTRPDLSALNAPDPIERVK